MTARILSRPIDPLVIADQRTAADLGVEGAHAVHVVRPVRVDDRTWSTPSWITGRPFTALAQAAHFASTNNDKRIVGHALDLITELGSAAVVKLDSDRMEVLVGLLDEVADIVERVATRIETDDWSLCRCGEVEQQRDLDLKVAARLRKDATLVRRLRSKPEG
jgi:hypothetical protein